MLATALTLALLAPAARAQYYEEVYVEDYAYDYVPSTGDATLDAVLDAINVLFDDEPEYVVERIVYETHAPPVLVREYLVDRRYAPADVYMIGALAEASGRSFGDVAKRFDANRLGARTGGAPGARGAGWGKVARDLGIKPGSPQFHALKRGGGVFVERARGRGEANRRDGDDFVAVPSARGSGRGAAHERGLKPGKGHGRDKGKGKGRGKDKD